MIDHQQLDELARLLKEATPGPWELQEDSCDCGGGYPCSHGSFPYSVYTPEHQAWGLGDKEGDVCSNGGPGDYYHHTRSEISQFSMVDVQLICLARELLPELVEEIESLRAENGVLLDELERAEIETRQR